MSLEDIEPGMWKKINKKAVIVALIIVAAWAGTRVYARYAAATKNAAATAADSPAP